MKSSIQVIVNGFEETIPTGSTIAKLIEHFGEVDADLIVEHNGRFIYPEQYEEIVVTEGDKIEFINPSFGG